MAIEAAEQPPDANEYATKADLAAGLERLERTTKADLDSVERAMRSDLEAGLERVQRAMKADLETGLERVQQATKADLEIGLTRMQHAIELLAQKSQTDMAILRADMVDKHNALSRWVIGFIVAVIVMLAAIGVLDRIVPLFFP